MMTPKEKAVELVIKFMKHSFHQGSLSQCRDHAKQCALIAVYEIINVTAPYCDRYEDYYQKLNETEKQEFWQEVKTELEKP